MGLAKPGEGVQRGFLEEGVNEMVQRVVDTGRGIRTSPGQEERLVLLSIWCVPVDGASPEEGWGEGCRVFFPSLA